MLVLSRTLEEDIVLDLSGWKPEDGTEVRIRLTRISGLRAWLGFTTARSITILRGEIADREARETGSSLVTH
jgi:sRNA-binding carbon storage regulator CsrA